MWKGNVVRIYTGPDNRSHFEDLSLPLDAIAGPARDVVSQLYLADLVDPAYPRDASGAPERPAIGKLRLRRVLALYAISAGKHVEVGIEDVEGDSTTWREMPRHRIEERELVLDGRQVLNDTKRRDHQVESAPEIEAARVSLVKSYPIADRVRLCGNLRAAPVEHLRRRIEPVDRMAGARNRKKDATGATPYFEHASARVPRLLDVEPHVAPVVIEWHAVVCGR